MHAVAAGVVGEVAGADVDPRDVGYGDAVENLLVVAGESPGAVGKFDGHGLGLVVLGNCGLPALCDDFGQVFIIIGRALPHSQDVDSRFVLVDCVNDTPAIKTKPAKFTIDIGIL